jgi:hypothetical protein
MDEKQLKDRAIVTISAIVIVGIALVAGVVWQKTNGKNESLLESQKIGVTEGCEVYRVKAKRLPPQLLWRCK